MYIKDERAGKLVYELSRELAADPAQVEQAQALTLDKSRPLLGLAGEHGLFASDEWWRSIDEGRIAVRVDSGVIEEMYVAGMDEDLDEDEEATVDFGFRCDDGSTRSASCVAIDAQDLERYRVGARVTMAYALDKLKKQPARDGGTNYAEILLEVALD